jgi:hypothetical protein
VGGVCGVGCVRVCVVCLGGGVCVCVGVGGGVRVGMCVWVVCVGVCVFCVRDHERKPAARKGN